MTKRKKIIFIVIAILVAIFIYVVLASKVLNNFPSKIDLKHRTGEFGATFSKKYCEELGLNWQETYLAILDDLKVRYLRLPVYWDEIEKVKGTYDFSDMDYMINEASTRDTKMIVVLGRRQPRWPECHSPAWSKNDSDNQLEDNISKMIEVVVLRYKNNPNIINWQVENEAFLDTFGVCPVLDEKFLQKEVDLVRSLDSRKIIITGSGEMSSWKREAKIGDIFGTTMYRVVYNSWFGYIRYFFPTYFYQIKADLVGLKNDQTLNIELQAEPWVPNGNMIYLTQDQINKTMSVDQFKANLQYAINLNFKQTYVWGVEWWYWQKLHGNPEYFKIGQSLFD